MKQTESQLFKSKVHKAFKDAPKRLFETGSGTCIPNGERDYSFDSANKQDPRRYVVTRLATGKFEVCEYKETKKVVA